MLEIIPFNMIITEWNVLVQIRTWSDAKWCTFSCLHYVL